MRLLRFFVSKTFIVLLCKAAALGVGLLFLLFLSLHWHTRQSRLIEVPDLHQRPLKEAQEILTDLRLGYEVIDSTQFDPDLPPLSVIDHQPRANEEVKRGRKIYLTLNPSSFRKTSVPNVVQVTYRNALSSLRAVGLEVGNVSYRNNIGKNMVLELRFNNETINPGTKIPKTSKIDLVLGNGRRSR
jgi:beta-lactam-binding protein with PASTA domain